MDSRIKSELDNCSTRDEVAELYLQLMSFFAADNVVWKDVNEYIINRWSISGLQYIKSKAWNN